MVGSLRSILLAGLLLLLGCFDAGEGQFLCADLRCPEGLRCLGGVCTSNPLSDSGTPIDAGPDTHSDADASDTGPPPDAGTDVPPGPTESCSPDPETRLALDENGDGRIDEGCPWNFGTPHLVEWANIPDREMVGIAFGASGSSAYIATSRDTIGVLERNDVGEAFAAAPTTVIDEPGAAFLTVTVNGDETLVIARGGPSGSRVLRGWTRTDASGSFRESETLGLEALGDGRSPSLSPDGLDLYLILNDETDGNGLWRSSRASAGNPFGELTRLETVAGRVTQVKVSNDGQLLFYESEGTNYVSQRPATGEFPAGEALPALDDFTLPKYLPKQREMWVVLAGEDSRSTGRSTLFRMQVCRDRPCDEPTTPCEGSLGHDGFSCYESTGASGWDEADASCMKVLADGRLSSISSAQEMEDIRIVHASGVWIGLDSPSFTAAMWTNNEPLLYQPAGFTTLIAGECVSLLGETWSGLPCARSFSGMCETRTLPNWLQSP